MIEPARIEEIQERVRDFVQALRKAQAPAIVKLIESYTRGFTDATQVRRSVTALAKHLEHCREHPDELPDMPIVHIAANRLEDVCKDALRAGVIFAARPTLVARSGRKLAVVAGALAVGAAILAAPVILTALGVDFADLHLARETGKIELPQGDQASVAVSVLVEAAEPAAVRGVEIFPRDHCSHELRGGGSCKSVDARYWVDGKLPTFELRLPKQAYGLLFAVADPELIGRVGKSTVLVAATEDTPEGIYRIPLEGAFLGYQPARCGILERIKETCIPRRVGPDARHEDMPVPTVVVEVVRGDPTRTVGEKRRKQAMATEQKRKAEERASQIAGALSKIKAVMDDTAKTLRKKRFEEARGRIDKLTLLFAPLDALAAEDALVDAVPVEVEEVRARFEDMRSELRAFEDRAFDQAFKMLAAKENKDRSEAELMGGVASRMHISRQYMEAIYTMHADEIEKRMDQAEKARLAHVRAAKAALEQRCGPLPTDTWKNVESYLRASFRRSKVVLSECLTPRLSDADCWSVTCDFKDILPTGETEPDIVTAHKWTFLLRNERIVRHTEQRHTEQPIDTL